MANITLNTMVKEIKSGKIAKVVLTDERAKTASIKFEDGTTKAYVMTTLKDKRRFEILGEEDEDDSEYIKEIMEQKRSLGIECPPINPEDVEIISISSPEEKEKSGKARVSITFNGQTKSPKEWAEEFNMDPKRIRLALRKGKTPEEIFNGKNK